MHYKNPILPGFHPDPSICRAGEGFYLVTSSFEYLPGIPIFYSEDLVCWRKIGHCLTRPSQADLAGCPCSQGIYAPTIRYHNGRFYVAVHNKTLGASYLVTAQDPAGAWSDPIFLPKGGIDPSLFFDEDGRVYLTANGVDAKGRRGILGSRIDPDTGALLEGPHFLWAGTGGRCPEGSHLYRVGKWVYLLIAEGGTQYQHRITLARARHPFGPFDACPHNPLLTHANDQTLEIQGLGHGDWVQDASGRWFILFLGFRINGKYFHHLGRETFLAPMAWDDDGWPHIHGGQPIAECMEADLPVSAPLPPGPSSDAFGKEALPLDFNVLRTLLPRRYALSASPGALTLYGWEKTLDDEDSPAFVGVRQTAFSSRLVVWIRFAPEDEENEAGLTVFHGAKNHYDLYLTREGGGMMLCLRKRVADLCYVVHAVKAGASEVYLRVESDKKTYRFAYSLDGRHWQAMGEGSTQMLSSEVIEKDYTGVYYGLYATTRGKPGTCTAEFRGFQYDPLD